MIKRILWAAVEKAYERTGLIPAMDVTVSENMACPIGAIYCDITKTPPHLVQDTEVLMHSYIFYWLKLNYNKDYLTGFLAGFDAVPDRKFRQNRLFEIGYKDGRNIRIRFEKEGIL